MSGPAATCKTRGKFGLISLARGQITSRICDEAIVNWIGGSRFSARRGMTGVTGNIYADLRGFNHKALGF
jgi:hypothetical protein